MPSPRAPLAVASITEHVLLFILRRNRTADPGGAPSRHRGFSKPWGNLRSDRWRSKLPRGAFSANKPLTKLATQYCHLPPRVGAGGNPGSLGSISRQRYRGRPSLRQVALRLTAIRNSLLA